MIIKLKRVLVGALLVITSPVRIPMLTIVLLCHELGAILVEQKENNYEA